MAIGRLCYSIGGPKSWQHALDKLKYWKVWTFLKLSTFRRSVKLLMHKRTLQTPLPPTSNSISRRPDVASDVISLWTIEATRPTTWLSFVTSYLLALRLTWPNSDSDNSGKITECSPRLYISSYWSRHHHSLWDCRMPRRDYTSVNCHKFNWYHFRPPSLTFTP